ncbi:MAG TPA: UvrD-helicase domain-containing protein, partial [Acidimicrobiales bacterium]|nr:UvrD-helicase domain-containing protein [Acidimicrobiales bacterium]
MTTADDHARTRIRVDLAATMLVVAGAGTGKTTALVQRIVELVTTGTATLREIAAITFTEAAAAELRDRVRRAIDAEAKMRPDDARLAAARHDVDEAAICTLHAFARRIITEHSVATGVPPGFEVLGDTAERSDFDARWGTFADALLADPDAEPALVRGFALGLSPAALVEVARSMYAQQDRLDADALRALATAQPGRHGWPVVTTRSVVDAIDTALAYEPSCTDPDDKLAVHLRDVLVPARALLASVPVHDAADVADEAVLQALDNTPKLGCGKGQAGNWAIPVTDVRAACAAAETARSEMLDAVRRAVAADLGARLAAFVVAVAEQRRIEGKLGFGDLLVCARDLLRRDPEAARSLRRRYTRLLVDEFQDT